MLTLRVRGLRDPGITLHQELLQYFCDLASAEAGRVGRRSWDSVQVGGRQVDH